MTQALEVLQAQISDRRERPERTLANQCYLQIVDEALSRQPQTTNNPYKYAHDQGEFYLL